VHRDVDYAVNNFNDGIHGIHQRNELRKNYLHWKRNKEAYAMADNDYDVEGNHPEDNLLVPEQLTKTNTNLD